MKILFSIIFIFILLGCYSFKSENKKLLLNEYNRDDYYEQHDTTNFEAFFLIDTTYNVKMDTIRGGKHYFFLKIKNKKTDTLTITKTITSGGGFYFSNTLQSSIRLPPDNEHNLYLIYLLTNRYGSFSKNAILFFKNQNNKEKKMIINIKGFVTK